MSMNTGTFMVNVGLLSQEKDHLFTVSTHTHMVVIFYFFKPPFLLSNTGFFFLMIIDLFLLLILNLVQTHTLQCQRNALGKSLLTYQQKKKSLYRRTHQTKQCLVDTHSTYTVNHIVLLLFLLLLQYTTVQNKVHTVHTQYTYNNHSTHTYSTLLMLILSR